ncbi:hypothetical protein MMC30_005430 [Trapelia coarctata]|nr:hypothetical protein [Trapelia coarctata]
MPDIYAHRETHLQNTFSDILSRSLRKLSLHHVRSILRPPSDPRSDPQCYIPRPKERPPNIIQCNRAYSCEEPSNQEQIPQEQDAQECIEMVPSIYRSENPPLATHAVDEAERICRDKEAEDCEDYPRDIGESEGDGEDH